MKLEEKYKAIHLRKMGKSYNEILKKNNSIKKYIESLAP